MKSTHGGSRSNAGRPSDDFDKVRIVIPVALKNEVKMLCEAYRKEKALIELHKECQ
jgi:hypothetical protein